MFSLHDTKAEKCFINICTHSNIAVVTAVSWLVTMISWVSQYNTLQHTTTWLCPACLGNQPIDSCQRSGLSLV